MPFKDKELQKQYNKKYGPSWYQKNKLERIKQITKRKKDIISWFISYKKTLKCSICPESDWRCLDFHHRDKEEKEDDLANLIGRGVSKETIMKEVGKCDVLCSNCHRKITIRDR